MAKKTQEIGTESCLWETRSKVPDSETDTRHPACLSKSCIATGVSTHVGVLCRWVRTSHMIVILHTVFTADWLTDYYDYSSTYYCLLMHLRSQTVAIWTGAGFLVCYWNERKSSLNYQPLRRRTGILQYDFVREFASGMFSLHQVLTKYLQCLNLSKKKIKVKINSEWK